VTATTRSCALNVELANVLQESQYGAEAGPQARPKLERRARTAISAAFPWCCFGDLQWNVSDLGVILVPVNCHRRISKPYTRVLAVIVLTANAAPDNRNATSTCAALPRLRHYDMDGRQMIM
jgi:hypothetical protein